MPSGLQTPANLSEAANTFSLDIADPGNGKAIPNNRTGSVALVSTAAQTRTLAVPTGVGLLLTLYMKTDGGDIVVTAAAAINQSGNTIMTFDNAGEFIKLESIRVGTALRWRVLANDGVGLS
jgi:hypothetical protein